MLSRSSSLLRSSSLESLGELANAVKVDSDQSALQADQNDLVECGAKLQDYAEDMTLYELKARIIYRSLLWEREWKQSQDDVVPVVSAVDSDQTSKPTMLKKVGLFASSLMNTIANKSTQVSGGKLLDLASRYIFLSGNEQRLMITSMGSSMLKHYCEGENPDYPSVIFDVIIVGTMVLTLAVDDALDDVKGGSVDDHLYSVSLKYLCDSCELHKRYASPQQYAEESSAVNHVIQYMILQLGYRVLIEKTLPFHAELALEYFRNLASVFPMQRFERYGLNTISHDVIDSGAYLNWAGNDVSQHLTSSAVFELRMLRQCVADGLPEDRVFAHFMPCEHSNCMIIFP